MQSTNGAKADAQLATAPTFQRPSGSGGGNKKGTSAERRATHNAIERARRESLNGRFLQLAASLPSISDVRRPSKSLIVNKSLDFVADAMNREVLYRLKIDNMRQENMQLRQQLNKFLAQAGLDQLPQPPMDELPVPMAEMGNKKRQMGLSASGPLTDIYDLDDDDGPGAAGSEGEGGKTSPTSSCSAASSMHASSLPSGVAGFTPMAHAGAYGQPGAFLSAPGMPGAANGTSPGASTSSEDVGTRERSTGFEDVAGNWVQGSTLDGQALISGAASVSAGAPSGQQQLTYAGLTFSSPGVNSGLVVQAPSSRPGAGGIEHFTASMPHGAVHNGSINAAAAAGDPAISAVPAVFAQNGQPHMFSMGLSNNMNLRNAQQLQQQQLHFQLQLQQQHHQQQQQQAANFAAFNPSSFFEQAPLQSASFMTAV